jgi:hypothetical protein
VSDIKKKNEVPPTSVVQKGGQTILPEGAVTFGTKSSSLHQRVAAAKTAPAAPAFVNPFAGFANMGKIVIFPDCSGSMSDTVYEKPAGEHPKEPRRSAYSTGGSPMGTKIDLMKQAVNKYLDDCSPITNYVGLASFPEACYESPTGLHSKIRDLIKDLTPTGGTPMGAAMGYVLDNEPITHGVIISDGCADTPGECIEIAKEYKAKAIKLDCVHIGDDTGGEDTLKEIASLTGGIYVKFSDMDSFRKNFQYLAPAKRSLLTSKGVAGAKLFLGAGDVKF